jgi:serine phosphatase RsbU (regulator of sigma subunit)
LRPAAGPWSNAWPFAVLVVVLLATGVLALVSHTLYTRNENRLLRLRVKEAGSILGASLPGIQTTMASAAELADATGGDMAKFRRFIGPYVGNDPTKLFVTASLWRLPVTGAPLTVVGVPPKLLSKMDAAPTLFARAAREPTLSVLGLLSRPDRRIGYAWVVRAPGARYGVYAERTIPTAKNAKAPKNAAFTDLNYALYLGPSAQPSRLLISSTSRLPLAGHHAAVTVPFGDTAITLVISPRKTLSGNLPRDLPWIIMVVGVLLAIGLALLSSRLLARRRDAETLAQELETVASENRQLYAEQRTIAQTLQHALLPDALPQVKGIESSAIFAPGEQGVEVGGDWYDLIALEEGRVLLVVGDVSGRGLSAASTMAALRFAIRAYATEDAAPDLILTKLSRLVDVTDSGQIATVLCLLVDVQDRTITFSSAGHLPPLLLTNGSGEYLHTEVGLPLGIEAGADYTATTVTVPPSAGLLAFTDGLVERRGEVIDEGLARLSAAAAGRRVALSMLLEELVRSVHREDSEDDTALVGLRWTT